jgi:hypothetical protein
MAGPFGGALGLAGEDCCGMLACGSHCPMPLKDLRLRYVYPSSFYSISEDCTEVPDEEGYSEFDLIYQGDGITWESPCTHWTTGHYTFTVVEGGGIGCVNPWARYRVRCVSGVLRIYAGGGVSTFVGYSEADCNAGSFASGAVTGNWINVSCDPLHLFFVQTSAPQDFHVYDPDDPPAF